MSKTLSIAQRTTFCGLFCAFGVLFPQIFHWIGMISGAGAVPGTIFLPMHIPVLLAGLLIGPQIVCIVGIVTPVVSTLLTNMPVPALLPFMIIELAGYGLTAGWMCHTRLPVIVQLIIAQLAGRILRAAAILIGFFLIGYCSPAADITTIWTSVITGLPGLLLQWFFIPLLVFRLRHLERRTLD